MFMILSKHFRARYVQKAYDCNVIFHGSTYIRFRFYLQDGWYWKGVTGNWIRIYSQPPWKKEEIERFHEHISQDRANFTQNEEQKPEEVKLIFLERFSIDGTFYDAYSIDEDQVRKLMSLCRVCCMTLYICFIFSIYLSCIYLCSDKPHHMPPRQPSKQPPPEPEPEPVPTEPEPTEPEPAVPEPHPGAEPAPEPQPEPRHKRPRKQSSPTKDPPESANSPTGSASSRPKRTPKPSWKQKQDNPKAKGKNQVESKRPKKKVNKK